MVVFGAAIALLGCSSSEVGEECSENDDCAEGLICPKAGVYKGHCTTECGADFHVCATRHGEAYFCHTDHVCAKECDSSSCETGLTCDTSSVPSVCSAQ